VASIYDCCHRSALAGPVELVAHWPLRDKNNPCREPGLRPPTRRSRWLRGLNAGVTPHAGKSLALFDEATEDLVLGVEDVPAEASSRFTKPQEQ